MVAGGQAFVIGSEGDFKVSSRISLTLGNVLKEKLEPLFLDHPTMKKLRNRKMNACGNCVHYEIC